MFSLPRWLGRPRAAPRAGRRRGRQVRPLVEPLEGRVLPALFLVKSAADAGPDTLRQAILDATTRAAGLALDRHSRTQPECNIVREPKRVTRRPRLSGSCPSRRTEGAGVATPPLGHGGGEVR
jgi:hypothetical protein